MRELAMKALHEFDLRDVDIARKWFVRIISDILIIAFSILIGYTIKTFFM